MDFAPQSITALAGPSIPAPAPSKSQKRLKADGVRLLEEFQREHPNVTPDRFQTKVLLEKIRRLGPSHDYYKASHLKQWFQRRVNKTVLSGEASPEQHSFPSLNEQALANLAILYQAQSNPPPDVIEVWAKLLGGFGATRQDVIAWVTHRVQMAEANGQRLLTPSDTTSPEPLASPTDYTFKPDPSQSPILPSSLSRISEPQHTPYHHVQDLQPKVDPTLQAILAGVTESLQKPIPPTDVPKSAAEFNAMFAPFEQHMTSMLQRLSAP